jgi:23S rRNA pseudouridine1911/1915/1917 synthase
MNMQKLQVLYEDDSILVINKPAGLVVHGDGKAEFETLADMILAERPEMRDIGEPLTIGEKKIYRPGIVHRLDKDTSGALILAKTQESFEFLKSQFQNHAIEKTYHACLYGVPKEREGVIDEPIGRSKGDVRKWNVGRGARGEMRQAITHYKVLGVIGSTGEKGSTEEGVYSYVEARPKTGRTHQLRVHFKSLNHPIIHDTLYAEGRVEALDFKRLALHALSVTFNLQNGKSKTVTAPFPNDFSVARKMFGLAD